MLRVAIPFEPSHVVCAKTVWHRAACAALIAAACSAPNPAYDRNASPAGGVGDVGGAGDAGGAGGGQPRADAGGGGSGPVENPLRVGLAGAWTFDATGSDVVPDASGQNADGTVMGGSERAFVAGKTGSAFAADSTRWVEVPAGPALNAVTGELTIAAWVKVAASSGTGNHAVVSRRIGTTTSEHYGIFATSDGKVFTYVGASFVYGNARLEPGRWTHVAITYADRLLRLYVEGNAQGESPADRAPTADVTPLLIGANDDGAGATPTLLWNGLIDEVALWSRALRPEELRMLVAGGKL